MRCQLSERGVSPVIGVVLMVAVVVVVAAAVSLVGVGFVDDLRHPAPTVGQSSGELVVQDGNDGGVVRLTHVAGDSLTVSDLEIAVDAEDACGESGRLVNLPAADDVEYEGDDIFDERPYKVTGPLGEAGATWRPGETSSFRLASSECDLDSGDTVTVRVVHTPTKSVIVEKTLTAK